MTVREVAFPLQRRLLAVPPLGRRHRGRALEALLVVTIVGTVIFAALQGLRDGMAKVLVLNAISLSSTERTDAVVALATTGVLPERVIARPEGPISAGREFGPPQWRDGQLVFPATARLTRLLAAAGNAAVAPAPAVAFRIGRAPRSGATVWLCGSERPPPGFEAPPQGHTTIPPRYLPHFCRET